MTFYMENLSGMEVPGEWENLFETVGREVLKQEGCPFEAEVSLSLVTPEEIRERNREFREVDRVTDVLSFPMLDFPEPGDFSWIEEGDPECFSPETGELFLGDILINPERVRTQAEEYGHSVTREFAFLIAHSMLHLLGFDHMTEGDAALMETRQKLVMDSLGIGRDAEPVS